MQEHVTGVDSYFTIFQCFHLRIKLRCFDRNNSVVEIKINIAKTVTIFIRFNAKTLGAAVLPDLTLKGYFLRF